MRTFRKSAGTSCTAPGEIAFLAMVSFYRSPDMSLYRMFLAVGAQAFCGEARVAPHSNMSVIPEAQRGIKLR